MSMRFTECPRLGLHNMYSMAALPYGGDLDLVVFVVVVCIVGCNDLLRLLGGGLRSPGTIKRLGAFWRFGSASSDSAMMASVLQIMDDGLTQRNGCAAGR